MNTNDSHKEFLIGVIMRFLVLKGWRMSSDIGEVTERAHSPTFPSLHLRHSSFFNPSVASLTSQLILQPLFRFSYVTGSSLTSRGEPPMPINVHCEQHSSHGAHLADSRIPPKCYVYDMAWTTWGPWPCRCVPWIATLKFRYSRNREKFKNSRKLWETCF